MSQAAGGWETWSWDESLFAGAARYYEQGRLPYAPGLAEAFGRGLALDGRGRLPHPPPPDDALDQLRRRYLGPDRRAGQGIRNTSPSGEDDVFQAAGFRPAETVIVPDQRAVELTADDLVARVFSLSSTAPHLFGDRQQDYEEDLREILAEASPAGRFSVRLPDNVLRIWRLAPS